MKQIGKIEQKVIDAQQKKTLSERAGIKNKQTKEDEDKIQKMIKELKKAGEIFLASVPDNTKK
jgi:hypothetical protein